MTIINESPLTFIKFYAHVGIHDLDIIMAVLSLQSKCYFRLCACCEGKKAEAIKA